MAQSNFNDLEVLKIAIQIEGEKFLRKIHVSGTNDSVSQMLAELAEQNGSCATFRNL